VNEVVQQVAADAGGVGGPAVRTHLLAESGVRSDPVALRRILENLVDNAIRSLDSESGSVVISTESALDSDGGSRVRIRIQDTGVGMSAPEVTQSFNDFYTTRDGGTGLGLSIVRRLVTDLGGTIRIESEKGKGTLVTVDLPSAESPGP
jgi:signal transduction histidine kinase